MSLEPDSALPFESDHAATARTQPLHEAASVPQSTDTADALSLFSPDPSPRQVPEDTVSHLGTTPAASAAAALFRKLFPSHRSTSLPSGEEVQASRDDFSDLLDARDHIAEEFTRFEVRCRETETRNERAASAINEIEERLSGLDVVRDLAETMDGRLNTLRQLSEEARIRTDDLKAQSEAIAHQLLAADHVTSVLTTLDARLAEVTEKDQRLLESEQMVAQLKCRAADTSANLERQLGEFETRKHVIEQAVAALEQRAAQTTNDVERLTSGLDTRKDIIEQATSEATRVTGLLSALETRLAQFTSPELGLGRAEQTLEAIERRAADTSANLERQLGEFETRKHVIEQAVAALEQRAAQTTNDVEQLTSGLGTRIDIIERATSEATWATRLLSALETRLTRLTSSEHGLGRAEQTLEAIERRATDSSERLTKRAGEFDAQEEVIERNLREARRIIEVLSGLETRIVNLTGTDQILDRADMYVGRLERRAAAAVLRLEETTTLKYKVDQELAKLRRHLEELTETARRQTGKRADGWNETCRRRLRRVRAALGPAVAAGWRAVLDWWSRIPHRGALVRALAIAVLLGVGATSLVRPFASIVRRVGRSSSTPVLLSRPLPEVMLAAQAPPSGVVGRFARDVVRSSATLETSEDSADSKLPAKRSAGAPVFIGALTIESQPPGATVFVDQKLSGKTPVHLTSLRAGEHLVRLEREGFEPWTASVRVPADRQTRVSPALQVDSPR